MRTLMRNLLITMALLYCMPASANDSIAINSQMYIYPYYAVEDNVATGIVPEMLSQMMGERFSLEFCTQPNGSGHCADPDIILGVDDEPAVDGYGKVSLPMQVEYVVCFRRNQPVESLFGLPDKHVIIVKDDYPFDALYQHRTAHILNVGSVKDAIQTLSEGYNDCAVLPLPAVLQALSDGDYSNIEYLQTPYIIKNLALYVNQSDHELFEQVKLSAEKMASSGKLQGIVRHWLNQHKAPKQNGNSAILYVLVILLVVTVGTMYLWISTLYSEVDDSSREQIGRMIHNPTSPLVFPDDNQLLQKVLSSAPFWFVINDKDGHIVKASRAFLRSVAQIDVLPDNAKLADLFDESTADKFMELDGQIYSGQTNYVINDVEIKSKCFLENRWIVKHPFKYENSSEVFILTAIIPPVFDTNLFYHNLTTEALIQAIIDSSSDLIYIKSATGTYMQANKAFYDYYQMTETQIAGKTDMELFGSKVADDHIESDKAVFDSGEMWSEQTWHIDSQCVDHKFENRKMPLRNFENHIFGLVGMSHDITDIDRYTKQVKVANLRLAESDRMKTSFLANLGHDIRLPLKTIIEHADLLADADLTYDQRIEIIENIQTNGNMLVDLVGDMVDYSKIEAGNIQIKYSDFNLNSIIADVYNIANSKKMQLNKDEMYISLLIDTIEDDIIIHSDSFRLKQILKNMLTTIIKFADTECIYFGYRTTTDKVFFFVNADRGDMTKDELIDYANVNQGGNIEISQIEESYGISIIIAQSIIKMMSGKLWVENINSGHPSFIFYIPYEHDDNMSPIMYDSKNDEYKIPDWSGHTILIAEDEELNFILLQGLMLRTKVKVIRAKNGIEAVEQYKANPDIEVVLMDVRMPEMNGLEASEIILSHDPKADIIAQTAYAIPEVSERCSRIGIHKLLEKPIDQGELFAECNKYLKRKQTANDNELMD